jgi:hypothetical protein
MDISGQLYAPVAIPPWKKSLLKMFECKYKIKPTRWDMFLFNNVVVTTLKGLILSAL